MSELEFKSQLDKFMEKLNKAPNQKAIKNNNGVNYIPIEIIEAALDSIFMGLWSVENLTYSIEINAVVVSVDLKVFHPIAKTWIIRAGVGSVPVQMRRGTNDINPMALQKNIPAAKAFAVKNACQSLGRRLGRNINRGWDVPFKADTPNFTNLLQDEN